MSSDHTLYNVFFNEHEYSLEFSELISANTRLLDHLDSLNLLPEGVFAEIIEVRHSLCRFNIYYSDQFEDLHFTPDLLTELMNSGSIPSPFKIRYLMVAEYSVAGSIFREHWKERSDLAGLIHTRTAPPVAERADFLIRSTMYDAAEIKEMQKDYSVRSILNSFRSFFPNRSSSSGMAN